MIIKKVEEKKTLLGINDPNLSWKATGVLAYLLRTGVRKFKIKELAACKTDGIESCKSALRELRKNNYFHYFELKQGNKIIGNFSIVSDVAIPYTEELKQEILSSLGNLDASYILNYRNI